MSSFNQPNQNLTNEMLCPRHPSVLRLWGVPLYLKNLDVITSNSQSINLITNLLYPNCTSVFMPSLCSCSIIIPHVNWWPKVYLQLEAFYQWYPLKYSLLAGTKANYHCCVICWILTILFGPWDWNIQLPISSICLFICMTAHKLFCALLSNDTSSTSNQHGIS